MFFQSQKKLEMHSEMDCVLVVVEEKIQKSQTVRQTVENNVVCVVGVPGGNTLREWSREAETMRCPSRAKMTQWTGAAWPT